MAQRNFVTHPLVVRKLTVRDVVDVTPRMRRITVSGPQLREFSSANFSFPAFISTGFDDHVKIILSTDGDIETALPIQRAHSIDWREAPHRQMRDYTPRRFDAEAGELDLDFVRHGDGPAALWAEAATPGTELHILGPKSSLVIPDDVDWLILAGDETALPAIGRYLDERTDHRPVQVVVEICDNTARQTLPLRDGDTLQWIQTPEDVPSQLARVVRELNWWEGTAYVWAAAESSSLLPLRRWAARERGLAKTHINVTGYWHQETARRAGSGADTSSPTSASSDSALQNATTAQQGGRTEINIAALLSPVPWLATRAALSLGLLDAVADLPSKVGDLALTLGLANNSVQTLVDVLAGFDVVQVDGLKVSLGPVGNEVLGDEHLRESFEDSIEARLLLSLASLAPALTAGTSPFKQSNSHSFMEEICTNASRYTELVEQSIGFDFVARAVPDLAVIRSLPAGMAVTVTGPGTPAFAESLDSKVPLAVVEAPIPLAALRQMMQREPVRFDENFTQLDAFLSVSVLALSYRTDQEAMKLLTQMSVTETGLIIEKLPAEIGDGETDIASHEAEERLLALAATGTGARSARDIKDLAHAAGWVVTASTSLGWDYVAFELARP